MRSHRDAVLFADKAEIEASLDPSLKALMDAPPYELPSPPPPWLAELLKEMDDEIDKPTTDDDLLERSLAPEHLVIEARADDYRTRVYRRMQEQELAMPINPVDPEAAILWFHTMISAKIHRALHGLADDSPENADWPADYDGSAKVALLGIDRSHEAWRALVERGEVTDAEAASFIADLVWLGEALEQTFPNARAFVRPAFDEPEEVSKLLAGERRW